MQQAPDIILRDIHRLPSPPLWPPAPGWWWVLAALVVIGVVVFVWMRRRRQRRIIVERLFDDAMSDAPNAPAQVAAMSALLRRAARRHIADADVVDGAGWLALLDEGMPHQSFQTNVGQLLLEGGFRREIDPGELAQLRVIARQRFLRWMGVAR